MRKEGKDIDLLPIADGDNLKDFEFKNTRVAAICEICNIKFVTKIGVLREKGFKCKACKISETKKNFDSKRLESIKEKTQKTNLERFGSVCPLQNEKVKEKTKQTNVKLFGVDHPQKNKDIREKTKQTNLRNFGCETPAQNKDVQEKTKQTNLKKFGTNAPLQNKEILQKMEETNLKKYGVKYTFQSEQQKEKTKKILLEKFGTEFATQNDEVKRALVKSRWLEKTNEELREIRKKSAARYFFKRNSFDSKWELAVWIWAVDKRKQIKKEPVCLEYDFDGSTHKYFPDFEIDGKLVEVKGNQFFKDGKMVNPFNKSQDDFYEAKHQCGLKNGVEFWTGKELRPILDYIYEKYTGDFLDLFKKDIPFPYLNPDLKETGDLAIIKHFHKSIYEASRNGTPSPLKAWQDKDLVLKSALNRLKYVGSCKPGDILAGFNVAKIAPKVSTFKPSLAERLISDYLPFETIFDPFSGFSGRLLGATNLHKKYIGQDIHPLHIKESEEIINYKKLSDLAKVRVQDILEDNGGTYDCLFTCPPYGGKEHWNENKDEIEKSCDEWIDICLQKYKCKRYLFVVDKTEKYKDKIVETLINKSHFGSNKEYVVLINPK